MTRHRRLFLVAFSCIVTVDQLSKIWAVAAGQISYNTGVSLGLFSVLPARYLTIILVVVMLLVGWLYRSEWRTLPIASGLFFGGGVSNLIDRVLFSGVRDWLPVPYLSIYNNLADYAIALGLIVVLASSLRKTYSQEVAETASHLERLSEIDE